MNHKTTSGHSGLVRPEAAIGFEGCEPFSSGRSTCSGWVVERPSIPAPPPQAGSGNTAQVASSANPNTGEAAKIAAMSIARGGLAHTHFRSRPSGVPHPGRSNPYRFPAHLQIFVSDVQNRSIQG